MPKFFFDIRDQHGSEYDEVGLDLPDLDAARTQARRALGEMMLDGIANSGKVAICVEIRDSAGAEIVEVVAASDDRDRH